MPSCWKCNAPIIFVDFEPNRKTGETPKSIPIDITPDRNGSIMLYSKPGFLPGSANLERNRETAKIQKTFARRVYGQALIQSYLGSGGKMYRIHFDTCAANAGSTPLEH